jgi:hypothetical protein
MTSLTRGPLPARIYWRRRLGLVAIGLSLVLLASNLFGGGGDGGKDPGAGVAAQVAGEPTGSPSAEPSDGATQKKKQQRKKQKQSRTPQEPVLAEPEGRCADSDIRISPSVEEAVAGRPVTVTLELRTAAAEACTWRVSADHVTMKITSGSDEIWTSRQCPKAVPRRDVIVRRDVTTFVDVRWKARRSDDGCPVHTEWAKSGTYHVHAAALGGEPAETRFDLVRPSPEVITTPAKPKQNRQNRQNRQGGQGADADEDPPKIR